MWRLRVVHTTGYAYQSPVTASYNEVRLTPRSDTRQNVVLNRVETVPATRSYRYVDYWGTAVTAFDLHAPHTELTVTSASVVETEQPDPVTEKVSWSDLVQEAVIDRYDELLRPTDYTPTSKRIAAVGKRIAKEHEPADAVTVSAELQRRGDLIRLGGAPYLHTLIATVPTAANAAYYAEIVSEKAILRRLVEAGTRIVQLGYHGDHGAYPAKLDDLAPKYLPSVPKDLFTGKPLIYRLTEKGYLLYSVGVNGKDENGQTYGDDPPGDDIVVRMPLPELKTKK